MIQSNDPDLQRLAEAEAARANWSVEGAARADAHIARVQRALDREFGDRLNELVSQRILDEMPLHHTTVNVVYQMDFDVPKTDAEYRTLARELVQASPFAVASINASDARLKGELEERFLAELPRTRRLAMARSGEIKEYLASRVAQELEARSGVLA